MGFSTRRVIRKTVARHLHFLPWFFHTFVLDFPVALAFKKQAKIMEHHIKNGDAFLYGFLHCLGDSLEGSRTSQEGCRIERRTPQEGGETLTRPGLESRFKERSLRKQV